jgi:putative toxin-antitoxin system antitoxin component (TIGR02293 family)
MSRTTHNPATIRATAHALRSQLGIQDQLSFDFREILKKLNELPARVQVKVVATENVAALAWTDQRVIHLQKSVYDQLVQGDVHARHIVAHEMGHVFLHHPVSSRFLHPVSRKDQIVDRNWQEMEADLFAKEFLMPASLVRQFQSADEISAAFHVSFRTAHARIAELTSGESLPLAPAVRAHADVISELFESGFSEHEISELVVPKRTLARRRADNELLTVEETDKALRLSRIAKQANRVFGDAAKAHRWLRKPKRSLNGETPVAFLASEEGARKVEEMLHRIDHGMAA